MAPTSTSFRYPSYASLTMKSETGAEFTTNDGFLAVNGNDLGRPSQRIYVARGPRVIGYNCPGWIRTHGYSVIEYTFEPATDYVMLCTRAPFPTIQPVRRKGA